MASLVYKHNSYYAVFSIHSKKKWIKIGRVDKKDARKILKHLEIEHLKGRLELKELKNILLNDFLDEYIEYSKTNKAPNTHRIEKGVAYVLRSYFGNVLLTSLDNKAIEGYKSDRVSKGLKPTSTNRDLATISFMLKKALEWSYINKIPSIKLLKIPKNPPKFLSVEEVNRLLECSSIWLRPILIVLRNTGMRIGETLRLKFNDIDLENNVILVRSQKTKNFRIIPINGELAETLVWLMRYYVNPSSMQVSIRHANQKEYLFCHPDGSRIESIKKSFNNACTKAGIKATPHTIRHTFASHLVMNQVDLVSIKELLGHSSISTTMIYSHVSREYKSQTVARLPWAIKGYLK